MRWSQKVTNEELFIKVQPKRNLLQEVIPRKLQLFGHCRTSDSRKIKLLDFDNTNRNNKVERPHREWARQHRRLAQNTDKIFILDIVQSYSLQELSYSAQRTRLLLKKQTPTGVEPKVYEL